VTDPGGRSFPVTDPGEFVPSAPSGREAPDPKILAFAPACNPLRGSERGVGWLWSRLIAGLGETWVITRETNREAIEAAIPGIPERSRLHFVYVEAPGWPRGWEPGKGGGSVHYLLWQRAALRAGRRLQQEIGFDLVWHLTFANAWMGSLAPLAGPPFVYGPVGGGVGNPWRLQVGHGVRGAAYEAARAVGRGAGRYLNPLARVAWSRARVILVQNPETREWLPRRHRDKARVCPNPILDETFSVAAETGRRSRPPMALFAGRLVAWKGMFLALRALAELPDWHLVVCGKGRDEKRLRRLAGRLGVADRVEFRGFVPRPELLRLMREEAAVLLFPSLHEEAGWVVVEARACGLPVVCIDRGGPPVLGGEGVAATTIGATVGALVRRLEDVIGRVGETPGEAEAAGRWTLDARRNELRAILREADLPVRHGGLPR
jgi:glycosyltransferase involved in cell wall biosynthesis